MCPVYGEEYDTSLQLLGRCSALGGKQGTQFGKHFLVTSLVPSELRHERWRMLLKFSKKTSEEVPVTYRLIWCCTFRPLQTLALYSYAFPLR